MTPLLRVAENKFRPPNIFATFTGRNFVSSKKYLLTSRYKKYGRNFVLKNHDLVKIRPYFIITAKFLGNTVCRFVIGPIGGADQIDVGPIKPI